ncbi:unnamed protein product [Larinioides sclopetarius]|uniref:Uncharacterized protein n=1 Tax=Larinioides sclopetarius TaxID=280406 RepID=A0AAV2B6D7_9ARAC
MAPLVWRVKFKYFILSNIKSRNASEKGTFGEESDLPDPKSTESPLYKFYYAIIEFLSAIADFFYFRLFGSSPD